jgi:hypothetical protein
MKTWQRILVVTVLLGIAVAVGFNKYVERERSLLVNLRSVSNLHQIGLSLLAYPDDNNGKLPDLSDVQSLKKAVAAYISTGKSQVEKYFVNPRTGQPYQPNSSLTYKERKGPNASADIALVYEAEPAQDGTRGVLFADSHADRVTEPRWQDVKKTPISPNLRSQW